MLILAILLAVVSVASILVRSFSLTGGSHVAIAVAKVVRIAAVIIAVVMLLWFSLRLMLPVFIAVLFIKLVAA